MDKLIRNALITLNCDDKEIRLFIACFQHGGSGLTELITLAKLQRSTAYLVVKSLIAKGLISEDHKAYGKSYTAITPEGLIRLVAAGQRKIGRQRLALEDNLSELQALYRTNQVLPRVRTYDGVSGLVSVWRDILTARTEILIWTNQATESKVFSTVQHQQFIAERREGGHVARVLTLDNPGGRVLKAGDSGNLRETRLLPAGIDFTAETYVYDQKVAILDYNHDIMGIITESQPVADAQRAMFEAAWQHITQD